MARLITEREKIPNFNSFSCLVDRIVIEQVKKTIFELKQEEEKVDYKDKIAIQDKALKGLNSLFIDFCLTAWLKSEYSYIEEARTFKS
jgi:hypothetical protein